MKSNALFLILLNIALQSIPLSAQPGWTTVAPMPTERQHLCSAVYNDRIYVFGGEGPTNNHMLNVNEMYDPATNSWVTKSPMPSALGFCNAGTVNGKIYVIGGWNGGSQTNQNWEYDPVNNTWAVKATMPTTRSDAAVAVVNNKIYAIGGWQMGSVPRAENEMYDPVTNTWVSKAPMPTPRGYFTVSVVNNKIYAIGSSNSCKKVEEYDPQTNTWTTKANMPLAKGGGPGSVVINNEIYVFGGSITPCDTTLIYTPATDVWRTTAIMPTHRYFLTASQVNDHAYVIGGGPNDNATYYQANEMFYPFQEKIFFSAKPAGSNYYSIYSMNPDGTNRARLFTGNYHRRGPVISSDHSAIYYVKRKLDQEIEGDSVWICKSNIDGAGEQILWTNTTPMSFGLRSNFDVSPDNQKLIFSEYSDVPPGRDGDIFEYSITTQQTVNLTNNWDYVKDDPNYSPDGSKIIYTKNGTPWLATSAPMYIMNADGTGNLLFQPNGNGSYARPEYSADASKVVYVYTSLYYVPYSLYLVNSDGTGLQQIIPSSGTSTDIFDPTFSRDASKLAFSRQNKTQMLITDLTGGIISQFDTIGINGFYEIKWGIVNFLPPTQVVGVSISSSSNPVCAGTPVSFTATPVNGGTNPSYQWKVNGTNAGTNSSIFNYIPANNDVVNCVLTSSNLCLVGNPATSNAITMIVHPLPADIAQPGGNASLQTGLVVYLPFSGNANDASGNLNNGVPNGGVQLTADRFENANSAYYFDGNNDWISIVPSYPDLFPYGNSVRSVSAWVNYQDHSDYTILYWGDDQIGQNGGAFSFYISDNGLIMDGNYDNGNLAYSFSPGTWYNIVCTYDGAQTIACYSNGQFIGNMTIPFPLQTSPVGHRSVGIKFDVNNIGQNPFKGVIDEVRIYNRILTTGEISILYNNSLSVTVTDDTICPGQPASLQIHNSQLHIKYQVLVNNVPDPSIQYGTGSTVGFTIGGLSGTSNLNITATDTATGCSITLDSTFVIHLSALNITVSSDTTIIQGGQAMLTAAGGAGYLWSNGMTNDTIVVGPASTTTYYVTVSTASGCVATDSVKVTVLPYPASPITVTYNVPGVPNTQVAVPVDARTFTNIKSLSLRLDYDPTHAFFSSFSNVNAALTGMQVTDIAVSPSLHKIMITWSNATPVSLVPDSRLVDLVFNYSSGTVDLTWNNTDNGGQDCRYIDAAGNPLLDTPTWFCYHNGSIYQGRSIAGAFAYNNDANTPLDSLHVFLVKDNVKEDSVWTNTQGHYGFAGKNSGTYVIQAKTNKPWQGVNGTDAAKILRHFTGLEPLTEPVRLQAADVNFNSFINSTDALQVKMRFVNSVTSFARGDWTFAKPATGGDTVVISNSDRIQDFFGLCVGDVNGSNSFGPGGKSASIFTISHTDVIKATSGSAFDLPLNAREDMALTGISFVMDYPEDLLSISSVLIKQGSPVYQAHMGQIRLAWSEAEPMVIRKGEPLMILKMRATENFTDEMMLELTPGPESELADENAEVIFNPELDIPVIEGFSSFGTSLPALSMTDLRVYPNPAKEQVMISISSLEKEGFVSISILNGVGICVYEKKDIVIHGSLNIPVGLEHFPGGLYSVVMRGDGFLVSKKFIIN